MMVKLPQSCCCCIELKTGVIIIGSLSIISCTAAIIYILTLLSLMTTEVASGIIISSLVFNIIGLIISILLVIGAAKGRPALLVPHIVSSVIGIVLMVILSILLFALIDDTGARIISGFIPLLGLPLPIYFCLVVISFYKQQKA